MVQGDWPDTSHGDLYERVLESAVTIFVVGLLLFAVLWLVR